MNESNIILFFSSHFRIDGSDKKDNNDVIISSKSCSSYPSSVFHVPYSPIPQYSCLVVKRGPRQAAPQLSTDDFYI